MKIVQAFKDSNILLKEVTKKIKNETKEPKRGFLSTFWGTLGARLLEHLLAGKRIVRAGSGNKKGKGIKLLMPFHSLTNFEINKYYENESRLNGIFSRKNLPK